MRKIILNLNKNKKYKYSKKMNARKQNKERIFVKNNDYIIKKEIYASERARVPNMNTYAYAYICARKAIAPTIKLA